MHKTSEIYREIISGVHWFETSLEMDGVEYGPRSIFSLGTRSRLFKDYTPSAGDCVSREISATVIVGDEIISRRAKLVPKVRATDGKRVSEWIQKGVFYIDTRKYDRRADDKVIIVTGYDDMRLAEADYPKTKLDWPAKDIDVVREIAAAMGVGIDQRTIDEMKNGYLVQYPAQFSQRETLGYIAAMYGGNFIMSDFGELLLICLNNLPNDTRYLRDGDYTLTIGGVRILV